MVGGAKSRLESNPISARDTWRAQTKPCVHQNPETPQRLSKNCVCVSSAEVQVSSGLLQGQGPWVQQTWVWRKPSQRSTLTPPQSRQNLHGTGETDSWVQEVQVIIFKIPKKGDHIVQHKEVYLYPVINHNRKEKQQTSIPQKTPERKREATK